MADGLFARLTLPEGLRAVTGAALDPTALAELRAEAMRPSLEAVGRFDPERVRRRFLDSFDPEATLAVFEASVLVGFLVLRTRTDHLYLDHLYIAPVAQGRGLGAVLLCAVQAQIATPLAQEIRLIALTGSASGRFYQREGFVMTGSDGIDDAYVWTPSAG